MPVKHLPETCPTAPPEASEVRHCERVEGGLAINRIGINVPIWSLWAVWELAINYWQLAFGI